MQHREELYIEQIEPKPASPGVGTGSFMPFGALQVPHTEKQGVECNHINPYSVSPHVAQAGVINLLTSPNIAGREPNPTVKPSIS